MSISDLVIPPQARLALALGFAAGCFGAGWIVHGWEQAAVRQHAVAVVERKENKVNAVVLAASTGYEATRQQNQEASNDRQAEIRTVFRTVYQDRPVPVSCAAPDDVVRLLDGAVASANALATGEPVSTVPAAAQGATPAQ